ncbi:MAG: DNA gyrase subunit A [Bacteroidales bacterium]|nr:DNA gyrase subunit A [Bacteroidales bacterium]
MEENIQNNDRIINVNIEQEMRKSYIDYSMSVIVARALPDVRDGFKPVHRRVLYGMEQIGNTYDKPTKKCARIVGEVLGKFHPHGDSSVYGALTRMAQPWNLRYLQVDGQGNFGSVDGDSPAAMRYTEARLSKISEEMLRDIEKDTVDMMDNFDATLKEPKVLPTRIPTLLVNGANGIAVGMATNMPTHNLTECIDGICAYIDNPEITVEGLMEYIKAPDFPTGGIIYGYDGVKEAYETGRGRIVVRAKAEIESEGQHCNIIVSEIPYGVNKAELIKHIANLADEKKIEGIANANDESDRQGMRIVIELKKDVNANVILNKLYKMTELQSNFSVNNIALVPIPEAPNALGMPKLLNLKDLVRYFVEHRHNVVIRRTKFDLAEAEKKAHILEGLIIACDNIDEVVRIIRESRTPADAQAGLEKRFNIDELQSKAIVDMRLGQLTGLRIEELKQQYEDLMKLIDYFKQILADDALCMKVVKDELIEIKEKYGDARRTLIDYSGAQLNAEDFIPNDDVVITISHMGYIKRTKLSDFKAQARGGVGSKGAGTRDSDFIEYMYAAKNHNWLMFFTEQGQAFWLKVYDIPEFAKNQKGRAIQNMLNTSESNKVTAFLKVESFADADFNDSHYLVFVTEKGIVKKTKLAAYSRPRANGINAINLQEDDRVVKVVMTDGKQHIVLANRNGRAITFPETNVRTMGRVATGVRGMRLDDDGEDKIVGMVALPYPGAPIGEESVNENENENENEQEVSLENLFDMPEEEVTETVENEEVVENSEENPLNDSVLVVSENGYGKRSFITGYRITRRGGKGVKTLNISDKTGPVIALMKVNDNDDLMIINKSGIAIRMHCQYDAETSQGLRIMGRAAQGVKLIDLAKKNDSIASVCRVISEQEEENVEAEEDTLPSDENLNLGSEASSNEENQ